MGETADSIKRRLKYAAAVFVLTFGLTAATAIVIGPEGAGPGFPGMLVPLVPIVGWFVVIPLILLLGVPGDGEGVDERDPLEKIRDRYAAGEISEAEFDRKVERLLETDAERPGGPPSGAGSVAGDDPFAGSLPDGPASPADAPDPSVAGTDSDSSADAPDPGASAGSDPDGSAASSDGPDSADDSSAEGSDAEEAAPETELETE